MTFGKNNGGITGNVHGSQLFGFIDCSGIVQVVKRSQMFGNLSLEIQHTLFINSTVQSGVSGGALLHKFGKHTGCIGHLPLGWNVTKYSVSHGSALPVGDDLFLIKLDIFSGNRITGHSSGI